MGHVQCVVYDDHHINLLMLLYLTSANSARSTSRSSYSLAVGGGDGLKSRVVPGHRPLVELFG
jgi:hypothetical protein